MKHLLTSRLLVAATLLGLASQVSHAQSVGIGTTTPAPSAALDVTAPTNNQGFLPPRLTEAQRNAIVSPAPGLLIYNTESKHLNMWDGTSWTAPISNTEAAYVPGSQTFGFTGGPQTYTVPRGVTSVLVDAQGASGLPGSAAPFPPASQGARVQATLAVTPGEVLQVFVGGAATRNHIRWYFGTGPSPAATSGGGYNGGGNAAYATTSSSAVPAPNYYVYDSEYQGGGGGATDVRRGGTGLPNRIVVAAGGGGSCLGAAGGNGGGLTGLTGQGTSGQGGTQTAGGAAGAPSNGNAQAGSLGQGGTGSTFGSSSAGGGGYYGGGGGGGSAGTGGAGGGSSYAAPGLTAVTMTAGGAATGNGSITFTPNPAAQYAAPAISGANVVLPAAGADGAVVFSGTPGLTTDGSQFFWDNTNNRLGIGTASPAFAVHATSGFYSSGTSAEFTFADRADNSKRFSWYATNDRVTLWHSVNGDGLTTTSTGALGLGTTAPGAKLDVRGGGGSTIDLTVTGRMHTGDGNNSGGVFLNGANTQFVGQFSSTHVGFYNNGWGLVMSNAGRVGIGTTNPLVPLDVQGGGSIGVYGFAYYNINGPDGSGFSNSNQTDISIRANGRVVGSEFNATSDRRLKSVIGLSNNAADLALLNQIRITDYTMRDRAIYGRRQFKKVIAQEVEEIFPQAVHQQTGFLPDVYAMATAVRSVGDSLVSISLPAGLPTGGASAGQHLKLVGPNGHIIATVAKAAAAGERQLLVRGAQALAGTSEVFVFGLEHTDVRTVDYEALSMLNVSATQELARQLAAAQALLRQQTQRADQAEASLNSFEQRLRALEAESSNGPVQAQR